MKKLIVLAAVLLTSHQLTFCQMGGLKGSGNVITKSFEFTKFTAVQLLDLNGKATITVGKPFAISINIDDNLAYLLNVSEMGNTLTVSLNGNLNNKLYVEDSKININITVPYLTDVFQRSNGDLTINNIVANEFTLKNNGNGNVYLNGSVATLNINAKGNGNIYANKIIATKTNVQRNGNGDIFTNSNNINTIENSGNGTIKNYQSTFSTVDYKYTYASNINDNNDNVNINNSVIIYLKNNSILPKKLTVVSYEQGKAGNGTNGFVLMPGQKKRLQFAVGSSIYLANNKQVNVVMSGKSIQNDEPFLVVKLEDDNKVFEF